MNGRVYDPELGRFLSADPTVQFVANLQSYNRYSYVLNNPLSFTDPTGFGRIPDGPNTILNYSIGLVGIMGAMAACASTGGAGCTTFWGIGNSIYGMSAAVNSGASWYQAAGMAAVSTGISMETGVLSSAAANGFPGAAQIAGGSGVDGDRRAELPLLGRFQVAGGLIGRRGRGPRSGRSRRRGGFVRQGGREGRRRREAPSEALHQLALRLELVKPATEA